MFNLFKKPGDSYESPKTSPTPSPIERFKFGFNQAFQEGREARRGTGQHTYLLSNNPKSELLESHKDRSANNHGAN